MPQVQWEYKRIVYEFFENYPHKNYHELIWNSWGRDGWELVSVLEHPNDTGTSTRVWGYFKRRINDTNVYEDHTVQAHTEEIIDQREED